MDLAHHICECNLIDYSKGPSNYLHISSGEVYDTLKHGVLDCQDKVNEKIINMDQYFIICKYIPGEPGSKFPQTVYKMLIKDSLDILENIPPISEHIFKGPLQ